MRLIDRFKTLLLDMNGTFMFNEDRFGPHEDFHRTYLAVGGRNLDAGEVERHIRACYGGMSRDYADPSRLDDFPSLREGIRRYTTAPTAEWDYLERAFTLHELGTISESSASLLRRLAQTHRLALVANIWAPKDAWLREFARVGIEKVFSESVFSSDFGIIKPSPVLFGKALEGLGALPAEALFAGDSLPYDMVGAKKAGLTTVWVTTHPTPSSSVDHVVSTLQELEDLGA